MDKIIELKSNTTPLSTHMNKKLSRKLMDVRRKHLMSQSIRLPSAQRTNYFKKRISVSYKTEQESYPKLGIGFDNSTVKKSSYLEIKLDINPNNFYGPYSRTKKNSRKNFSHEFKTPYAVSKSQLGSSLPFPTGQKLNPSNFFEKFSSKNNSKKNSIKKSVETDTNHDSDPIIFPVTAKLVNKGTSKENPYKLRTPVQTNNPNALSICSKKLPLRTNSKFQESLLSRGISPFKSTEQKTPYDLPYDEESFRSPSLKSPPELLTCKTLKISNLC